MDGKNLKAVAVVARMTVSGLRWETALPRCWSKSKRNNENIRFQGFDRIIKGSGFQKAKGNIGLSNKPKMAKWQKFFCWPLRMKIKRIFLFTLFLVLKPMSVLDGVSANFPDIIFWAFHRWPAVGSLLVQKADFPDTSYWTTYFTLSTALITEFIFSSKKWCRIKWIFPVGWDARPR